MPEAHDRIIAEAAKAGLSALGVTRKGRSRTWIDDHGWWLINIEFQPSSHARGCYLNIGEQHLWVVRNHLILGNFERPLGGMTFVEFAGDETAFAGIMAGVVAQAVQSVVRRRRKHGDGTQALRRIAKSCDDDLDAGIAFALLGDSRRAHRKLTGAVHVAYRDQAKGFDGLSTAEAAARATAAVATTREALRLPSTAHMAW